MIFSDAVGDVVRATVELNEEMGGEHFMIFKFVPVPSSMLQALWSAQRGDDPTLWAFDVRVHEKFEFPSLSRGRRMAEASDEEEWDEELTHDGLYAPEPIE